MSRRRPFTSVLVAALLMAAGMAAAQPAWPEPVARALAAAGVPDEAMSAIVMPVRRAWFFDGPVWARDADRPVQPGSTMKVLTAAVALERLGPAWRTRTELASAAPIDQGVLRGDLVLRGGGDPGFNWPQLWALLHELRDQGVHTIAGDVRLDRERFHPARHDQGLPPFDDGPEWAYNVIPDALLLNGNVLAVELQADADQVRVRSVPALEGVTFVAPPLAPTGTACGDWEATWQTPRLRGDGPPLVVEFNGPFPPGCQRRLWLQLMDRDQLAGLAIRQLWREMGGRLDGGVRAAPAPADARVLAQWPGRPLGEWLQPVIKQSDNAGTRLLYLHLGAEARGASPDASRRLETAMRAEQVVRGWLRERGIDDSPLVLDNGSGLSRRERLSPRLLAGALRAALAGPRAVELLASLPIVAVDGTMRNRLTSSPAAGGARLKTGTLRNVAGLAGTVRDTDGREWILVAILNHERARQARGALDALVDELAHGRLMAPPGLAASP